MGKFETLEVSSSQIIKAKIQDLSLLVKLRLSFLVVISAVLTYLFAAESFSWLKLVALISGGFLVTGASNGLNQWLEKDLDKMMDRTKNRPIAAERMTKKEGFWISVVLGIIGLTILFVFLNPLSGILGTLALFTYVAIYTPLKRITPFAVFVGAFPGAIPPMLGYVAETGSFGLVPGLFFAVQFIWQFPHFWAIAWKIDEDYSKAGFSLLPSKGRKDKTSGFLIFIYALFLIPVSLTPFWFNITGTISAISALILGLWFAWYALQLYLKLEDKAATRLMFASFFYLPIMQLVYLLDKI